MHDVTGIAFFVEQVMSAIAVAILAQAMARRIPMTRRQALLTASAVVLRTGILCRSALRFGAEICLALLAS